MAVRPLAAAPDDRRRARPRPTRCLRAPGGVGQRKRPPGCPARRAAGDALGLDAVPGARALAAAHRRPGHAARQRHLEPLADHRAGLPAPARRRRRRRQPHRAVRTHPDPGPLPFFTTQLTSTIGQSAVRCQQVAALCRFVAAHINPGFPPVVTGDLNAEPDADEIRLLGGHKTAPVVPGLVLVDAWSYADPMTPGWTWDRATRTSPPPGSPAPRIDYVLVGLPTASGSRTTPASWPNSNPPAKTPGSRSNDAGSCMPTDDSTSDR